jgi:hypothetical protein
LHRLMALARADAKSNKVHRRGDHLPITGDVYLGDAVAAELLLRLLLRRLLESTLLVDMDFVTLLLLLLLRLLLRLRTADAVLLVDADLFLDVLVAAVGRKGSGEGFGALFVTFPSDVRSLMRRVLFAF